MQCPSDCGFWPCEFSRFFLFYTAADRWGIFGNCQGGSQCGVSSWFYLCKFWRKHHSCKIPPLHSLQQFDSSSSQFFRPDPNLGRVLKSHKLYKASSEIWDFISRLYIWLYLHLRLDRSKWLEMRLQGRLIVVAFSHVLQDRLPSIHRVVTEQALVDESISVLPLDVAPDICGIL